MLLIDRGNASLLLDIIFKLNDDNEIVTDVNIIKYLNKLIKENL